MTSDPPQERDTYIDFLRAFSLLVVVAWHWVFTIVIWKDDGPHATNPIGFTTGLWAATWLLQVMPLFFYVGGYSHLVAWERARSRGERLWLLREDLPQEVERLPRDHRHVPLRVGLLLQRPREVAGEAVIAVCSGGNVDPAILARALVTRGG